MNVWLFLLLMCGLLIAVILVLFLPAHVTPSSHTLSPHGIMGVLYRLKKADFQVTCHAAKRL